MNRLFSTAVNAEEAMRLKLVRDLSATLVKIVDVSGGCGSMYEVTVASPKFAGLPAVKQHR